MVTDQQYRDMSKRVDELEKKINMLSRSLSEMMMKSTKSPPPARNEDITNRKDVTKYFFNGEKYSKRSLVLAVIKQYIQDNGVSSITSLWEIFPDYVQGSLGVVKKVEEAECYQDAKDRYYFGDDDILALTEGNFVVCKDWSAKNIKKFLDIAETLGYQIKPIYRD